MIKSKLVTKLKRFKHNYVEYENEVIIKSKFNMNVHVIFEEDSIEIITKLRGWNFLTGFRSVKLTTAIIYNFLGTLLLIPVLMLVREIWGELFPILILVFSTTWSIGFILYYTVRSENIKNRIYSWVDKQLNP